ncbi:MAG: DMT family transporter [Clostridiales Family XIII bacterium]|jgi:drug/metabolite transporter (DMT)-like permease|nr:DMT family transporter [Clostridiales Family XIII bacterium]
MNSKNPTHSTLKSTLLLTLTALIWGMGFVGQKQGMDHIGPFLFNALRSILGAPALFAVLWISSVISRKKERGISQTSDPAEPHPLAFSRQVLTGGVRCGVFLCFASITQQIGLIGATAGKSGFLTTLYIVLVPILGIFLRKKTHWNTWTSVAIAAVGLYFLCVKAGSGFQIAVWDIWLIVGAFFWAGHILIVDHTVSRMSSGEVLKMCVVQFSFNALISFILTPFIDGFFVADVFDTESIKMAMAGILYCGLVSTAAGYTLQAVGQRYANPSAASIIMSLESVFSVIGGFLLLGERLSPRELIGCAVMFAAVVLAQLPERNKT